MGEVIEYLFFAARVGMCKMPDPDSGPAGQDDRLPGLFERCVRQFGEPLGSGHDTDERRNLPTEFDHRVLYLGHKLKERGHRAESHSAASDPEYSPKERGGVTGRESDLDHQSGEKREIRVPHDITEQP